MKKNQPQHFHEIFSAIGERTKNVFGVTETESSRVCDKKQKQTSRIWKKKSTPTFSRIFWAIGERTKNACSVAGNGKHSVTKRVIARLLLLNR